jgi:hypothetical protein
VAPRTSRRVVGEAHLTIPYPFSDTLSEALLSSLASSRTYLAFLCRGTRRFSTEGYRQTYRLYPLLKEPLVSFAASSSFLLSPLFYLSAMFYVGLILSIYSEEPPVSCGWIILGG